MANRFLCGFDDCDTAGLAYEWFFPYNTAERCAVATGLTGNALRIEGMVTTTSSGFAATTVAPEGVASGVLGFRWSVNSVIQRHAICAMGDSTRTHLLLVGATDGTLEIWRSGMAGPSLSNSSGTKLGTTATATVPGQTYYIEIEFTIHESAGVVKLYLNGNPTPDLTITGADTQNAGTATVTWIGFGGTQYDTPEIYGWFDDIYFNDTAGTVNNGVEGDVQVHSHYPASPAGATAQWDRSTGSDQWATVDDHPQDTADYNSTATLDELDTLNLENFQNSGADLLAVQVTLLAQKVGSGTCALAPVIRMGGTDYVHGTDHYLGTSWQRVRANYDVQPDTDAWNETDFNAMEVGYQKTA